MFGRILPVCPVDIANIFKSKFPILTHFRIGDGKIPLIALEDVGVYNLWIFDNPQESAGLDLEVATDQVSMTDIANTFTKVTGKKGVHKKLPLDEYMEFAEPYPNAPANWAAGSDAIRDKDVMTWRENFTAWWRYWGEGKGVTRDMALLDKIHPQRIKSLEEWMRTVNYDGKRRGVLKGLDDLRAQGSVAEH